jgi:hypothetical protein
VRLLALYQQIPVLEAEDDLRALLVAGVGANPGEKGQAFKKYDDDLRKRAGIQRASQAIDTLRPGVTPFALAEREPGSIAAERARQKAAAERLEDERREEWERQHGKGARS